VVKKAIEMNRVQILHRAIAAGNLAVVLSGLGLGGKTDITLNVLLLLFIEMMIRIKFWVDDEQYFDDVREGKLPGGLPYQLGIGLAVLSWLVWYLAGFFIKDVELSSLVMVLVMALSTLWIVAAAIKEKTYAEQVPWLFFNAFYALGFLLLSFRSGRWNPFESHVEGFTSSVIVGLIVVFLFDLIATRIIEHQRKMAAQAPQTMVKPSAPLPPPANNTGAKP
jgi:hypothetical protein